MFSELPPADEGDVCLARLNPDVRPKSPGGREDGVENRAESGLPARVLRADQVGRAIRRAADKGGPIQYAPGKWRLVMAIIRAVPAFVFHKTKL